MEIPWKLFQSHYIEGNAEEKNGNLCHRIKTKNAKLLNVAKVIQPVNLAALVVMRLEIVTFCILTIASLMVFKFFLIVELY